MTERLINVVAPSGQRGTMPESEAIKAFKDGAFRPETADETAQALQKARNIKLRESAGGELEAFAGAAGRSAIDAATAPVVLTNAAVRGLTGVDVGRKVTGLIDKATGGVGKEVDLSTAVSGGATLENLAAIGGEAAHRAGLTEQTGEATGRKFGERMRDTAEANPYSDIAGQIVGGIAGGAPLARVAGAAGKAVTAGLAGKAAATAGQRVAGAAAAGALEGIGQGVQAASEEQYMAGNLGLTGERIAAHALTGAVLSGAITGGAAKGAAMLERRAAQRAAFGAGKAAEADAVEEIAGRVLGDAPAKGLGGKLREAYEGLSSFASGGEQETIAKYGAHRWDDVARNGRSMALNRDAIVAESAVDMTNAVRTMRAEQAGVLEELSDAALRRDNVAKNLAGVDQATALGAAREQAATLRGKLSQLDDAGVFGVQPWAKGGRQYIDDMLGDVMSGTHGAADSYVALDSARRQLSKLGDRAADGIEGAAYDLGKQESLAAYAKATRDLAKETEGHLTSQAVWGKQGVDHAATLRQLDRVRDTQRVANETILTRVGGTEGAPVFAVDPGKIEQFMGGLGTLRSSTKEQIVKEHLQAVRDLSETIVKGYDLGAKHGPTLERLQRAYGTIESTLAKAQETVKVANQIHELTAAEKAGLGAALAGSGAMIGSVIGGQHESGGLGAGLGFAAGALLRPGAALMQAARLQAIAGGTGKRMQAALTKFFGHGPALGEATGKTARAPTKALGESIPRRATTIGAQAAASDAPRQRRERVVELSANPQLLAERVQEMIGDQAGHLPLTEAAMAAVPMRAVQYLKTKLPPAPPPVAFDGAQDAPVSPEDQDRFDDAVRAVSDPIGTLEGMSSGKLTTDQVEAVQFVYPELYKEMATAMFDYVAAAAEAKRPLQYNRRIQADLLFGGGGAIEPSMSPEFMRTVEQASQGANAKQKQAPARQSRAPNVAQHHQSLLDKINL